MVRTRSGLLDHAIISSLNPFFIRSMARTAGVFFLLLRQWVAEGFDNFLGPEKVFSQNLAGGSRPPAGAVQATGSTALGSSRSHSRQWAWSQSLHVGRRWSGSPLSSTDCRLPAAASFHHIIIPNPVRCVYGSSTSLVRPTSRPPPGPPHFAPSALHAVTCRLLTSKRRRATRFWCAHSEPPWSSSTQAPGAFT
jgi:hypothetical protein